MTFGRQKSAREHSTLLGLAHTLMETSVNITDVQGGMFKTHTGQTPDIKSPSEEE